MPLTLSVTRILMVSVISLPAVLQEVSFRAFKDSIVMLFLLPKRLKCLLGMYGLSTPSSEGKANRHRSEWYSSSLQSMVHVKLAHSSISALVLTGC